jgi:hypothetical protein
MSFGNVPSKSLLSMNTGAPVSNVSVPPGIIILAFGVVRAAVPLRRFVVSSTSAKYFPQV